MDAEDRPLKALEDYRMLDGHPVLLQGTRVVHAFPGWLDADTPKAEFRTSAGVAWCNARVKVVLAEPFDAEAKDACPTCAQYVVWAYAHRSNPYRQDRRTSLKRRCSWVTSAMTRR